ncbi:MAG: hypothetical protein GEU77_18415 [Deltaproteobacteria bacterium]|nr:hypothetical protein [Deltaproteobacteria bacterium]
MNSERQKREEEVERLLRGAGLNREADLGFQEEVRKAASAIVEEDASKVQKSERVKRAKPSISLATVGLWIFVIGAGLAFSIPSLGAPLIVCGIAVIVWTTFLKPDKKK